IPHRLAGRARGGFLRGCACRDRRQGQCPALAAGGARGRRCSRDRASFRAARPRARTDMTDPAARNSTEPLSPVVAAEERQPDGSWTWRLIVFLRVMACLSMLKGLYHWAAVCGFIENVDGGFFGHAMQWQTATVFFAVIDLVAAVGLWLAAPWGAV